MSDLATIPDRPLTAAQVCAHAQLIQEVMKARMKDGTHYGLIPGCDKPSLFKAGAEVILSTFQIASEPDVFDLSTSDEVRYRVMCRAISQGGRQLGTGVGECSSNEEKYRWRKAVCDEEFDETAADRKRQVWKRGNAKSYQIKQVRTNPSDLANTVLKMAKKRAQIDMTLTCTAASDVFAQDLEDLEDAGLEAADRGRAIQPPQKKSAPPAAASVPAEDEPPPLPLALSAIAEVEAGTMFLGSAKVKGVSDGKTGKGAPYTIIALADQQCELTTKFWGPRPDFLAPEITIDFEGECKLFQGKRSFFLTKMVPAQEAVPA